MLFKPDHFIKLFEDRGQPDLHPSGIANMANYHLERKGEPSTLYAVLFGLVIGPLPFLLAYLISYFINSSLR